MSYDDRLSDLLFEMATAPELKTLTHGTINLNPQILLAAISSTLSSQRETLRSLLQEIGNTLNSHRAQANTLTAISFAVASFVVAGASLIVAVIGLLL